MRKSFLILVALIGSTLLAFLFIHSQQREVALKVSSRADSRSLETSASADYRSWQTRLVPQGRDQAATPDKTLQLVKTLSEISLQPGGVTPENADQWKRNIEELIEQGKTVIPILEEFFQTNGDIRFDSIAGGNLLEASTLRIAFLKVLFDIPTPDNVQLQERILRVTTDPDEIALLARQLELQEPGQHREVIVQAANAALQMAQNGGLPGRDASSVVKILADYGIPAVK